MESAVTPPETGASKSTCPPLRRSSSDSSLVNIDDDDAGSHVSQAASEHVSPAQLVPKGGSSDGTKSEPGSPESSPIQLPHPLQMYTARLRSEADYARYKACKDSAESFYSRLATFSALHSYGYHYLNPLTLQTLVSQYQQQQLAAAAAIRTAPPAEDLSVKSDPIRVPSVPAKGTKRPAPVEEPKKARSPRKKAARKLAFDEDKSSPVSGTIIRELAEGEEIPAVRKGDIDPEFNVVEVTDEAKAELAKIENKIGDFICRLCKEVYADAFQLAQHRCSMIVYVEYRCPECEKVFNCPANLASHRRWHKPRGAVEENNNNKEEKEDFDWLNCEVCGKKFKKAHTLRKHLQLHSSGGSAEPVSPGSAGGSSYSIADLLSPSKRYRCQLCSLEFPSLLELDAHKSVQHASETFPCRLCPETFYSLGGLSRHIAKQHPLLPPSPVSAGAFLPTRALLNTFMQQKMSAD